MATLAQIRAGLKVRLATVTGLECYEHLPDTLNVPGAAVHYLGPVDGPYATFGGNAYDEFLILLAVGATDLADAQTALDEYMSKSGSKSIQAAIEGDPTLAAAVDFSLFNGWEEAGEVDVGGIPYHAARARVNVWHT